MNPEDLAQIHVDSRLAWEQRDVEAAARLRAALPALQREGSPWDIADACLAVAMVSWRAEQDIAEAERHVLLGIASCGSDDQPRAWLRLINFLLFLKLECGQWMEALPLALSVRRRAASVPEARAEAVQATTNLAWVLWQTGDLDQAEGLLREAASDDTSSTQRGQALGDLIGLLLQRGRVSEAEPLLDLLRQTELSEPRRGEVVGLAEARVALARGDYASALDRARRLLAVAPPLAEERAAAFTVASAASLALADPAGALRFARAGLDKEAGQPASLDHEALLHQLGRAGHAAGQPDVVLESLDRLERLHKRRRSALGAGLSRVVLRLDDEVHQLKNVELQARSEALQRANAELQEARRRAEQGLRARQELEAQLQRAASAMREQRAPQQAARDLRLLLAGLERALSAGSAAPPEPARLRQGVERSMARLIRVAPPDGRLPESDPVGEALRGPQAQLDALTLSDQSLTVEADLPLRVALHTEELLLLVRELVSNAARAAGPGGAVLVRATATPNDQQVELVVEDSGPGVHPAERRQLFEPFVSDVAPDRGLGLTLASSVVDAGGGTLTIEDSPLGGARVVATLPALYSPHAGPQALRDTILLVEDEPMVRTAVKRQLSRAGHTLLVADDGRAGLEAWRAHRDTIRCVVTDVVMPRMSGAELATRILDDAPETPIIIMSGYTAQANVSALLRYANVRFLPKPFGPQDLATMLDDLVNRAEE